jgi:hypothetical protein
VNSGVTTQIDGSLTMMDNGGVDLNGAAVVGATGTIGGTAQSNFHVKASGNVSLTGGAALRGGTITVDAGGSLSINSASGTTAVAVSGQGTTTITGDGSVWVNGRLDASTALAVSTPDFQLTAGGDFRIGGGVAVTFSKNISFNSNSDWHLAFPDTGAFAVVAVTGSVNLGGRFHLQLPNPPPTGTVKLVTAASITGTFNGAVSFSGGGSRRLLGTGTVQVNKDGQSIDYVGSGAASLGCVGLVAAFVLALF